MAYDSSKPAGTDSIQSSDDTIRANFAQIVANFSTGHVWDNSTAANCIHNLYFGTFSKNMTDANNATTDVSGVGFEPQVVLLFGAYCDSSGNLTFSFGISSKACSNLKVLV